MFKQLLSTIMKKYIFLGLLSITTAVGLFSYISYQESLSELCCKLTAESDFNALANDAAFVAKHESPIPFKFESAAGEMITFTATDGKSASAFFLKSPTKSKKYLLVFQEWWGLNDHIKQEAEKYFNDLKDVNVLAIDLYDGKVATTPEEAGKYMQGADPARLEAIIKGAMKFAGKGAKFSTVGWCFGGGWSLKATLLAGKQAKSCVMYYGMPVQEVEKLETIKAPVLGIFGSDDKWINPEVVAEFEKNMKTAGKELTVSMYEADHAFANPSNPNYEKEYADEAYQKSLAFIKMGLK